MVNILTVPVDAFTNIFLAGLVVAISQKGGKWLVLLVVAYELIRWLRLKMFKMSLKGNRVVCLPVFVGRGSSTVFITLHPPPSTIERM
eukprot:TRINITY_DN2632_c0_g2_i5.p1 TRINITY_DN2632_c0_g2~~TRINITY_DN2632_c0_g2_i5.p1  ORF type:complete len:101 (+),score=25.18 TRINITY_DN2632_c0_g2_i5:42-305(+)